MITLCTTSRCCAWRSSGTSSRGICCGWACRSAAARARSSPYGRLSREMKDPAALMKGEAGLSDVATPWQVRPLFECGRAGGGRAAPRCQGCRGHIPPGSRGRQRGCGWSGRHGGRTHPPDPPVLGPAQARGSILPAISPRAVLGSEPSVFPLFAHGAGASRRGCSSIRFSRHPRECSRCRTSSRSSQTGSPSWRRTTSTFKRSALLPRPSNLSVRFLLWLLCAAIER